MRAPPRLGPPLPLPLQLLPIYAPPPLIVRLLMLLLRRLGYLGSFREKDMLGDLGLIELGVDGQRSTDWVMMKPMEDKGRGC